ncbi:MAG: aldo/keto reductase [Gracilibacteraceae bacterium]|jgi:aryl-alcohol dehydrogenase-like predicted oxidoreductase|nr:aldo/keto reductase [Gracilibacteraceae bacterium]
MRYNNFPGTSLKVSALSLGAMMFGGQTSEADSLAVMDCAYERGVNFWDTASLEGPELGAEVLEACDAVWRSLAGTRFGYNR